MTSRTVKSRKIISLRSAVVTYYVTAGLVSVVTGINRWQVRSIATLLIVINITPQLIVTLLLQIRPQY